MDSNAVIEYYDTLAKSYDKDRFDNSYGKFIDFSERKILTKLVVDSNKDLVVLDLACGSGRFLDFAGLGIDASKEMISVAKEKFKNKALYVAEAEKTPLESNSVDIIIIFHLFMHLNKDKIDKILAECNRILKPKGRIIFDIPSQKRRSLLKMKKAGWHGVFSLSSKHINSLHNFRINRSFGILFLPIHRFPKFIRHFLLKIDFILSNSFLKEYSSYLIFEVIKNENSE